ncbi:MAG: sensor histidine kinase, partial [Rikenellaceae bacterium]|nr:sensor histidine kinase [Rikenellaceae bacterium]
MAKRNFNFSYKGKRLMIIIGLIIGCSSLYYTNALSKRLELSEKNNVEIWSDAISRIDIMDPNEPLIQKILNSNNSIPFIMTDEFLVPHEAHRIPAWVLKDQRLLRKNLEKMAMMNPPIEIPTLMGTYLIFYGQSSIQTALYYFPFIQISIITLFIIFSFLTFSSTNQNETNRIWIGMAKETAHQLGTPTSSLLGWIEYLRSQNVDPMAVEEMNKDLTRLLKVVDRFSKIGADTVFEARDITEVVNNT